jgi:hypothetical protein
MDPGGVGALAHVVLGIFAVAPSAQLVVKHPEPGIEAALRKGNSFDCTTSALYTAHTVLLSLSQRHLAEGYVVSALQGEGACIWVRRNLVEPRKCRVATG